jgi:hypothetical protein
METYLDILPKELIYLILYNLDNEDLDKKVIYGTGITVIDKILNHHDFWNSLLKKFHPDTPFEYIYTEI